MCYLSAQETPTSSGAMRQAPGGGQLASALTRPATYPGGSRSVHLKRDPYTSLTWHFMEASVFKRQNNMFCCFLCVFSFSVFQFIVFGVYCLISQKLMLCCANSCQMCAKLRSVGLHFAEHTNLKISLGFHEIPFDKPHTGPKKDPYVRLI